MTICTMFWHGGTNYTMFNTHDKRDAEQFPSIKAAIDEFAHRLLGPNPYHPCVNNPSAWIVVSPQFSALGVDYPDIILSIGPRGGIKIERV